MTHRRNTAGLERAASERSISTKQRAEEAIRRLGVERRPITFKAVHEVSGVSTAWLYRHMKERIIHLREQSAGRPASTPRTRASDTSKDAIIATLRGRVKQLEAENRELRGQMEVAYGQLYRRS